MRAAELADWVSVRPAKPVLGKLLYTGDRRLQVSHLRRWAFATAAGESRRRWSGLVAARALQESGGNRRIGTTRRGAFAVPRRDLTAAQSQHGAPRPALGSWASACAVLTGA